MIPNLYGFFFSFFNGFRVIRINPQFPDKVLLIRGRLKCGADNAIVMMASGAFDYNTLIRRVVGDMTASGLRAVDYASGRSNRVDVTADEMRPYEEHILEWYHRLVRSTDIKISNSANFMLASRYLRNGQYEKAQETLDLMPDRNDIIGSMADKFWLQVEIDKHQGKSEKAAEDLQRELHLALNKVQLLLYKMMNIELECGELLTAKKIADKSAQMVTLFEMWKYSA